MSAEVESNTLKAIEDELQCSVCNELFITPVLLNCKHSFCKWCIGQWTQTSRNCPICRTRIQTFTQSVTLENCINRIAETLPPDKTAARKTITEEREKQPFELPELEFAAGDDAEESDEAFEDPRHSRQVVYYTDEDELFNYNVEDHSGYNSFEDESDTEQRLAYTARGLFGFEMDSFVQQQGDQESSRQSSPADFALYNSDEYEESDCEIYDDPVEDNNEEPLGTSGYISPLSEASEERMSSYSISSEYSDYDDDNPPSPATESYDPFDMYF